MKLFLVSNMYPSKGDPLFGVFVKNFKESLQKQNVVFSAESLIKGKRTSKFHKIFTYLNYYFSVIYNHFFKQYDLIYVHYLSHNSVVLYLLLLFKKKSPLVVNVHGSDIINSQKKFINIVNSAVLRKTNLVVTPSQSFKELMLDYYNFLTADNIFVSPSGGINAAKFYPIEREVNAKPTFGFVSRIDEGKGWDDLLRSLDVLNKEGFDFKVKMAGGGLQENKMKQMIIDFNLVEKVTFLGLINQNELVHLYNEIDVLIFPTKKAESLGLVGLEAMSCKKPVIGSNIAGLKTYIEEGKNGYLFEPGDFMALSKTILKFYKLSETKRKQLEENALITASQYDAEYVTQMLKERLYKVCYVK